jgi:hypothetical protein
MYTDPQIHSIDNKVCVCVCVRACIIDTHAWDKKNVCACMKSEDAQIHGGNNKVHI